MPESYKWEALFISTLGMLMATIDGSIVLISLPDSLPQGAPALVLAVPSVSDNGLAGPTAEIATILRVDNPALDVRTARIDHGGRGDPAGIRAVLADAAARRPAGAPAAVVVPPTSTPTIAP